MFGVFNTRIALTILAVAFPVAALADITQTVTLTAGSGISLDTGANSTVQDIVWTGSQLNYGGSAKGLNIGPVGAAAYASLTSAALLPYSSFATTAPIPASSLTNGDVFAVLTNGGNPSKAMVSSLSGTTLTFTFTTYEAGTGGTGGGSTTPTVTAILNNSSTIPVGFPNYGIAPSSLFVVQGTNLAPAGAPVLQDSTKGLQTTLNSVGITVVVNGITTKPALYYTSPTQLAAVLPAATPVGTGTLVVNYNGTNSAAATIQVVPSALGITTYNGSGLATDAVTGNLLTYTQSGKPGEIIILWSTGLGADPADSDNTYTSTPHTVNTPIQVYIGGVQATAIAYSGASVYPGVSVIGLTIPAGVPTGCHVPLAVITSGATVSNVVTLPIAANGGICADPAYGLTGDQITTLGGQTTVRTGDVVVLQDVAQNSSNSGTTTTNFAEASFQQVTSSNFTTGGEVSLGGCSLDQNNVTAGGSSTSTGLDAGTMSVVAPGGTSFALATNSVAPGLYFSQLSTAAIPTSGGTFTFTATGGKDVGAFSTTVNFPNPILTWTNQSSAFTVTRASGLPVTWTGGASGSYVIINGSSSNGTISGSFTCVVPQSAGQFTVPAYILLGLPVGTGTTQVENTTNLATFSVSGLDRGYSFGAVAFSANSSYK